MKRTGGDHHSQSATRSKTLKGRASHRKGQKNIPRSAQVVGLKPRPKPDPEKKPWPSDCIQIVASRQANVNVAGIRGRIVDESCADCRARLAVDSVTISTAYSLPIRNGRPLRFICASCCLQYDRTSIQHFVDLRDRSDSRAPSGDEE